MGGFAGCRTLGLFIELFLKSTILLSAGMLGARLLRRRSASLRHFLISLSLVGLAFLPAFSVFVPGWHARWLPGWAAAASQPAPVTRIAAAGTDRAAPGAPGDPGTDRAAVGLSETRAVGPRSGSTPFGSLSFLASGLAVLWVAGLVLILARLTAGLCGVRRLTREGTALEDSAWQRLLSRFLSTVFLSRKVDIKAHPEVIVPLTWGFRRPVVIMPDGAKGWTEDERSSALFHELSHVKRGDFLVMLLVRLSLAVFWLNPLCWIALKMLKSEQEKACDELVLRAGIRPSTYAHNLLSFKRLAQSTRSPLAVLPGVLGMFGRSEFRERLLVILGQKMAFKEVSMKTRMTVSILAFLAVAFIGLARPEAASAIPETGPIVSGVSVSTAGAAGQQTAAQDVPKSAEKPKKEEPKAGEPKKDEDQVKKEVKIIRRVHEHGGEPVEIKIFDGQTEKTIKLDGSVLIVKKGKDGKTVISSPEGKEIAVIGGESTRLEIKAGKLMVLDEGKDLDLIKEPKVFTVIEGDEKVSTVLEGDQKAHTLIIKTRSRPARVEEEEEETEEPEHVTLKHEDGEYTLAKRCVVKEPTVSVNIDEQTLEKKLAETQAVIKKLEEQKLAESNLEVRQEALRELEKSLQALQEELAKKEEKLKTLERHLESIVEEEPEVYITHKHGEAPDIVVKEVRTDKESQGQTVKIKRGDEASVIMLNMRLKDKPEETYEKSVAKLKQGLPQGYALEPKFVEETGMMVIKITGPKGTEEDWQKVQKLVEEVTAELKK